MGLIASICCITLCVISYFAKSIELSNLAFHYAVFFLGISLICFAIEKNKLQTERRNND